jgi:hypothetical protein
MHSQLADAPAVFHISDFLEPRDLATSFTHSQSPICSTQGVSRADLNGWTEGAYGQLNAFASKRQAIRRVTTGSAQPRPQA